MSTDSSTYRSLFCSISNKIKSDFNVKIITHNRLHRRDACAYVYLQSVPYEIHLYKNKQIAYSSLIKNLLHEVGHTIDYRKKKNTKRIKLYSKYLGEKYSNESLTPKELKMAVLGTEYMADMEAIRLVKKYGIQNKVSEQSIKLSMSTNIMAYKYIFSTGKEIPKSKSCEMSKSLLEAKAYFTNIKDASDLFYSPVYNSIIELT